MSKIPTYSEQFAEQIYDLYKRETSSRSHLGASLIGHVCDRFLWLTFRHASPPMGTTEARIFRLFDTGHREEARVLEELEKLGIEVWTHDEDGKQFRFSEFGGHFAGSVDGVVRGILDGGQQPHLIESKTYNKRRFAEMKKAESIKAHNYQHYAQMQCYMHALGLTRALYVAVCKDDDSIHAERVKYNHNDARLLIQRAESIIFDPYAPPIPEEAHKECRFCDQKAVCRGADIKMSCRSCAHVRPLNTGQWLCEAKDETIFPHELAFGCALWKDVMKEEAEE